MAPTISKSLNRVLLFGCLLLVAAGLHDSRLFPDGSVSESKLDSTNAPAVDDFVTIDSSDATKFKYQTKAEMSLAIGSDLQAWDADLDDLADGTLTGTKVQSSAAATLGVIEIDNALGGTAAAVELAAAVAGRSLTLNTATAPDSLDADAELYSDKDCLYVEDPAVEDLDGFGHFMTAVTVTRVWCETDTGTASINIENDDGTAADMLTGELVCDAGEQTSCASGCDVNTISATEDNYAQYTEFNVSISATASTPTKVSICVGYTKDD